ncbi:MAG: Gfo/Idh/MocA family oxidoreductase [Rhodospirillaceae bacterium]|nr:Gfo/Idh/MocA family oxidoreductase [Rhodospirillales bacterium]MBT3906636.1 Gfo/Idh/MocA family oxidoreductase [Rhodospirillaceae bacterium]MBT4699722.1 Gfo/Idh/MocA family oxidoreductase [Rhodospirillaceae bacterium]MBT5033235.1 Gfo/Idh/MocA family oxidoreductase [Rhodospirillaceae bacterium]MBT6218993.1 Gfo/Idh/MocA family oxidoreductase [Rhodospirillaceae bacterium]
MTLEKSPILTAVVGLGVGEQHAHMYAELETCRVKWLYDMSREHADEVSARVGQGDVANSFEQILSDTDVSIVSLATFDHMHFDEVIAAFNAGKHVFVEKPLCRTLEELATLEKSWQSNGHPHLQSNLVLREAPVYRQLKEMIERGELGSIYAIDGDYLYGRLHKITEGWRENVPDYSVMEGGGIHMIDLMVWLASERPEAVTTVGNNISTRETSFDYNDFMASTFEFPSGLIGRITANFGSVHRHHHVLRVFGTEATFIYDDMGPRIHRTRDEDARAEILDVETLPNHKGALIPGFIDAILAGTDPAPAAHREFDLISICGAADMALAAKKSVEIDYL